MHKRKRVFPTLFILTLVAVLLFGSVAIARPLPNLTAQSVLPNSQPSLAPSLAWPNYGQAAIGAEGYGVLETHGKQVQVPTASVAKIMTALAVLYKYPLAVGEQGPTLTLTKADVALYNMYYAEDGSIVPVKIGEKITEYQALESMLLPSANNMADTMAIWAYGSMSNYISFANSYAATIGMNNSRFANDASGFLPKTVSTAHDLVILGENAMQNSVLAQIVSQKQARVPVAETIHNVNWLLGQDGVVGIKTGNTDQAGGTFIFASKYAVPNGGTVTIVGAIMKSPNLTRALTDAVPLLNSTRSGFQQTILVHAGEIVGHYAVPWDDEIDAVAGSAMSCVVWQGTNIVPTISLNKIGSNTLKGTTVGSITSALPGAKTVQILLQQDVTSPPWYWRVFRIF